MTQAQLKEKSDELQKELMTLQKKYGIEIYAANVALGSTVGQQEVIPMVKFRFLDEVLEEVKDEASEWVMVK